MYRYALYIHINIISLMLFIYFVYRNIYLFTFTVFLFIGNHYANLPRRYYLNSPGRLLPRLHHVYNYYDPNDYAHIDRVEFHFHGKTPII